MDAPPAPAAAPPPTAHQSWARTVLWIVIAVIVSVNVLIFFKSCRDLPGDALDKTGKMIDKAGQALSNLAAAFQQKSVTTAFISYATTISNHQRLQVATVKQTEIFTQTNQSSTAFGYVPLPDVVVEARAPVEYTYYLDFAAPWNFVLSDGVLIATAPPLHFNKPSVDASAISYEVRKGHFKTAEAQESLKRSLTALVQIRARENIPLVRENARRQTAEFIEHWLAQSFTDGKQYPVRVYFADEKVSSLMPNLLPPGRQTNSRPQ